MIARLWGTICDAWEMFHCPRLDVHLRIGAAKENDPFYAHTVQAFYKETHQSHGKMPLLRRWRYGVATCVLPPSNDKYFGNIEASGRRNVRKALRSGAVFRKIDFNNHLAEISEIRTSTDERQGALTEDLLSGVVESSHNPPSLANVHDYPFFGVFAGEKLVAYAQCLVAGDVCMLEHILGHYDYLGDGVVPLLVTGIAEHCYKTYPRIKFYTYGTFFGASLSMRRFKKKFGFLPHTVTWILE